MWLVNTRTLQLEFFSDGSDVRYAILSHTWEDGETSFQAFQDSHSARSTRGYCKITRTCELALQQDPPLDYCWVDTCCIDKTSSAELSEAINSMYRWYRDSSICFVFLADLPSCSVDEAGHLHTQLSQCRWFTRGWTLQELIAPSAVSFFDQEWHFRGSKESLGDLLCTITSIPEDILRDAEMVQDASIAMRMSWAACRKTTRIEDTAYCLLGIFGVYMTMIYGEGLNAFTRLQEEIIRNSSDRSIFAWKSLDEQELVRGLLALSPIEFSTCTNVVLAREDLHSSSKEYGLSNKGVRFSDGLYELPLKGSSLVLDLRCTDTTEIGTLRPISVRLLKSVEYGFVRLHPTKTINLVRERKRHDEEGRQYYVARTLSHREATRVMAQYHQAILIRGERRFNIHMAEPSDLWDSTNSLFLTPGRRPRRTYNDHQFFYVHFSFLTDRSQDEEIECFLVCDLQSRQRAVTESEFPVDRSSCDCQLLTRQSPQWRPLMDSMPLYLKMPRGHFKGLGKTSECVYEGSTITAVVVKTTDSIVGEDEKVKYCIDIRVDENPIQSAKAEGSGQINRLQFEVPILE